MNKPKWDESHTKRAKEVLALARGGWRMGDVNRHEPNWARMERNASYKWAAKAGQGNAPATRQQARKHLRDNGQSLSFRKDRRYWEEYHQWGQETDGDLD
jgi:hypothetical protein